MFQEYDEFRNPKLFENLVANLTDNLAEILYLCQTRQAVVHATHCKTFCPCQKNEFRVFLLDVFFIRVPQ